MQPKDYYKILGVSETATDKELKSAFRKIAQESHPDRHPGDKAAEERFKEASEAYDILSDPEKRRKYDALRKYGFDRAGFGASPGRGGFAGQGFPGGVHVEFENLQDVDFADLFSDNSPFAGIFEQLFAQAGASAGGRSRVRFRTGGPGGGGRPHRRRPSGRGPSATAPKEDGFFRRDGLDAHCTVWLKLEQLEKGVKVKVRTPAGKKVLVTVPAHSRIGSVLRLPGLGYASGETAGDQYVHLEAVA